MRIFKHVLFAIFLIPFFSFGTHIVGGDFWVKHQSNYVYQINLNLYFDLINGNPGAKDRSIVCHLLRKSDDERMKSFLIPLVADTEFVNYEERECYTFANVSTAILRYRTSIMMSPDSFNHPQGYYLVWDRCCRNRTIINIFNPGKIGQLFYAEVPPVVKNNLPYINNTPRFSRLPNIIFCNNQFSTIDFSANDPDGDSLVYDLIEPIVGYADTVRPVVVDPIPGPYQPVLWIPGFGINNQIPGNPALQVNPKTGSLTLKPNLIGLFVFAVRCQEFRNGRKIGEVRREFQQVVVDCQPNSPPSITLRQEINGKKINNGDTLNVVTNRQNGFCFPVRVNDPQIGQTVLVRAVPQNLMLPSPIKVDSAKKISSANDTLQFRVCLPLCYETPANKPLRINIIAEDNGCAGSLGDTTYFFINIVVAPLASRGLGLEPKDSVFSLSFGQRVKFDVVSKLPPEYVSNLSALAINNLGAKTNLGFYNMPDMSTLMSSDVPAAFNWFTPCLPLKNQPIKVVFINTTKICELFITDTSKALFSIIPKQLAPKIYVKENPDLRRIQLSGIPDQEIQLTVVGEVNQNGSIKILPEVKSDLLNQYEITLAEKSGKGQIESPLIWKPKCLGEWGGDFSIKVFGISNTCNINTYDTIRVDFNLKLENSVAKGPVNLITLNGDGLNDHVDVNKLISEEFRCGIPFKSFEVYNRWGFKVYESSDPAFKWSADNLSEGLYYYLGNFENYLVSSWILIQK